MGYPGGKSGAGVFQTIINHMPPHRVYIEPFAGGGAILRLKRPAAVNIAIDLSRAAIAALARTSGELVEPATIVNRAHARITDTRESSHWARADRPTPKLASVDPRRSRREDPRLAQPGDGRPAPEFWFSVGDGIALLERYPFRGDELVYCDPPYLQATRTRRKLYTFEMSDKDHARLLRVIRRLPCRVMISGYWTKLYREALSHWYSGAFLATNRAGQRTTEWIWSNFPEPVELHDYRYLGENFRERERIGRKKRRWVAKLHGMPILERRALLAAIGEAWGAK